jgi:hypothetical protein
VSTITEGRKWSGIFREAVRDRDSCLSRREHRAITRCGQRDYGAFDVESGDGFSSISPARCASRLLESGLRELIFIHTLIHELKPNRSGSAHFGDDGAQHFPGRRK